MTGLNLQSNKSPRPKVRYQDKYNLKRINGIKDKGVKINMLMRLIGKRNQEIKYLKKMLNECNCGSDGGRRDDMTCMIASLD